MSGKDTSQIRTSIHVRLICWDAFQQKHMEFHLNGLLPVQEALDVELFDGSICRRAEQACFFPVRMEQSITLSSIKFDDESERDEYVEKMKVAGWIEK